MKSDPIMTDSPASSGYIGANARAFHKSPASWILFAALVIAAALRVWYLSHIVTAPDFREFQQDLSVQDYHARALLSGDWTLPEERNDPEIPTTPFYRPPGYPYLLAAVYAVTHGSYLVPRIVNMILGLISIFLTWRLARLIFGIGPASITVALCSVYWGFIYYEGEVNDPAVFVFLLPCLLLALHRWADTFNARWALAAGAIMGLYAIMRPNILLFGPFMAAWMLWVSFPSRAWMRLARGWIALAAATAVFILPVTMRNYVVSGEFVPISTYFGQNLLIGNSEESDGITSWTPYLQQLEGTGQFSVWEYPNIVRGLGREVGNENLTHSEASSIFARKAVDWIRNNKLEALKLTLKKAVLFWSPWEITENKVVQYEKEHYPPLKYLPGFAHVFAVFFLGCLFALKDAPAGRLRAHGAESAARPSPEAMLLLVAMFILAYYVSFLPFFVNARARHPLAGLFFLIAGYGLWRMALAFYERRFLRAATGLLLLAALYALGSVDIYPYQPDKARWHYARSDSWLRAERLDKAQEEAERMLRESYSYYMPFRLGHSFALKGRHELAARLLQAALSPNEAEQPLPYRQDIHFHVGVNLAAAGRAPEAMEAFREALRLNPKDARAHNDLGVLLEAAKDYEAALEHYQAAVDARPDFALAYSNLGNVLGILGDPVAAVAAFEQAVEFAPDVADYHFNLALHLAAMGDTARARVRYLETLDRNPEDARALNNLGLLLADAGNTAEAESRLRQALEARPDYALARVNLGQLLLKQGEQDAATRVLQEGLVHDPGNAELRLAIGYHYAQIGDYAAARRHFEEALRIAPELDAARQNLQAIDALQ